MSKKAFILIILMIFCFSNQLNLIPDRTNPFLVESPSKELFTTFVIKFSFPEESKNELGPKTIPSSGLTNNQFIGLKFPQSMGPNLKFDLGSKWDCELSDGINNYNIVAVIPSISNIPGLEAEKNIAYCQLKDYSKNIPLKIGLSIVYTLRIKFSFKFTNSFIRGISLFTSSSNTPEKIIIDSLPSLGSLVLYNDWKEFNIKPLELLDSNFEVENEENKSIIYPGVKFDIILELMSNDFLNRADHIIVINYPKDTVSPPISVSSIKTSFNDIALKGNLSIRTFGENSLALEGINEDLVPGRQFFLTLMGFTALNTNLGSPAPIEICVFYKNTYSVVSYFSTPLVTVNKNQLTATANHPEFWDIYRNGAWPIRFSFKSSTQLSNSSGMYVVIRQTNAKLSTNTDGNIVTFIASTCDFSENTLFDNSFGNRSSCFPLRLDHDYQNKVSSGFNGSGIFFYLNSSLSANKEFFVTVWVFADICGGNKFDNGTGNAKSIPRFDVTIHRELKTNLLNEDRFDFDVAFAEGSVDFDGNCWNNKIQSFEYNIAEGSTEDINTADDSFKKDFVDDISSVTHSFTIRFKEVFSWRIGSQTDSPCTSCYGDDISVNMVEKFLFSQSNSIDSQSYFLVEADLNLSSTGSLITGLPGQWSNDGKVKGTITVLFSKGWFTGTDNYKSNQTDACYLSWALANPPSSNPKNSKVLNIDISDTNTAPSRKNFIGARRGDSKTSEFNESASFLGTTINSNSKSNIMKLISNVNEADENELWQYFPDEKPLNQNTKVAWFTNCVTWKIPSTITSLYTYIDIQFIWTNKSNYIFSNTRLIKLFPEGGVFHDKTKFQDSINDNPYINHVVISGEEGMHSTVCLIEIDGSAINMVALGETSANVFALWLGFGVLLETDYSDAAATYPIGPLYETIESYGLQSQTPMHPENLYVNYAKYSNENVPLYVLLLQLQNPKTWGLTTANITKGQNTSSYHFLMGSVLLITKPTDRKIQAEGAPVFIPYYCPFNYNSLKQDKAKYLNFGPSVFGAWLNMNSHSNISNVRRYLNYGETGRKMSILLSRTDNTKTIKTGPYKGYGDSVSSIEPTEKYIGTLRWKAYTDPENNVLEVYNGKNGVAGTTLTCTGFSVFFNINSISLNKNIKFIVLNEGKLGYYNSVKKFYISGKVFTKAAFWGGLTASATTSYDNMIARNPLDRTNTIKITDILRPNLASFLENGKIVVSNKVGFSCVPADVSKYDGLTNYFYENQNSHFILDLPSSDSTDWAIGIEFDKNDVSKSDAAGNVKLKITTPLPIPIGSNITFDSDNFSTETICGIIIGSFAQDCSFSNSEFTCKAPSTTNNFKICCYNIDFSGSIDLKSMYVNFNSESSNNSIASYLTSTHYDARQQIDDSEFTFNYQINKLDDIINQKYAKIDSISYFHSNQLSGFGKITFTISLARQPTRNIKISILGNMSPLIITGITPRCTATFSSDGIFGTKWDNGDALIDSCVFSNSSTPIQITTKNVIYKCEETFLKIIYVSLWPIKLVNWNDGLINNSFIVNMENISSKQAIALNNQPNIISLNSNLGNPPLVMEQFENLCHVSMVFPKIPGEFAAYKFDIDLDTNKDVIKSSKLNEVTIFWPFNLYGSHFTNKNCYYNNLLLNCFFSDEGILNIRFNEYLPIGTGKPISIIITGVPNPSITDDLLFACTINTVDNKSGSRINVLTGSGILEGGLEFLNDEQTGSLIFLSVHPSVVNENPRELSTHKFRITFDLALNLSLAPIVIDNTPVLHILFPNEYNLSWQSQKPKALIQEYSYDESEGIKKSNTYNPSNLLVLGNMVSITLNDEILEFTGSFKYWDIELSDILNPNESTISDASTKSKNTGPYIITLTNTIESVYYTTATNVNTYASEIIEEVSFNLLSWNRGNRFNFDDSKWIIDLYSSPTEINKLQVKAGRYNVVSYRIRLNNNLNIKQAATFLSLTDNIFKTSQNSYEVSSNSGREISFLIGAPCSTLSGNYMVNFSLSDQVNFAPLSTITIIVDSSTKGILSFDNSVNAPFGGSIQIPISLNEYNFEELNIRWRDKEGATNDLSATITTVKIEPPKEIIDKLNDEHIVRGYSYFSVTALEGIDSPQLYSTSDPDSCWTFYEKTTLSIKIEGVVPELPESLVLDSYFKYGNNANDPNLDKNSVKFTFTPPIDSLYLYCVLVCITNNFPSDSDIISPKLPNKSLIQFYSSFYNDKIPSDIIFQNLVRGQKYKLRCLVQSTHADETIRKIASVNIENPIVIGTNDKVTSPIVPLDTVPTQCAKWNFLSDPGADTYIAMLNYCQNLFSAHGWSENGCIICSNNDGSETVEGLSLPKDTICLSEKSLRFLQSPIIKQASNTIPSEFVICAVPHPLCKSDVSLFDNSYNDIFSKFVNNLKSRDLVSFNLKISNIKLDEKPVTIFSDEVAPVLDKLEVFVSSKNVNGFIKASIVSQAAYKCYWMISTNEISNPPTFSTLESCMMEWCGNVRVSKYQNTFSTDLKNLKSFAEATIYNIFLGCYNDIPNPQKRSNVMSIGNFSFPNSTVIKDPTGSMYLKYSLSIFLILVILIIN